MYYQYFGLNEAPFSIAVNPRYLFMSPRHRDALAHLLYGVGAGGGFILLTGEVGTGKTTINRCLLEQLPPDTDVAIILNPALNAMELLASVCDELGVEYDQHQHTLKTLTDELQRFLVENHARGRKTVLLIDEAQHLDFDVLEQIRLLTNLETNNEKLLQIILIGQPELAQMLARPELRQLNQRITARYNLEPLDLDETGAYIHHRLQVAGMSPDRVLFPNSVVRGIYNVTRGIPRIINVLCDRMLLGAYGRNKSRADHSMLKLAAREVLGESYTVTPTWAWLAIAAVVGVLVWAGGWLLGNYSARPVQEEPLASSAIEKVVPQVVEVRVADVVGTDTPVTDKPPQNIQAKELEEIVDVVEVAEVTDAQSYTPVPAPEPMLLPGSESGPVPLPIASLQTPEARIADVMLQPGDSLNRLWAIYSDEPAGAMPCSVKVQDGIACFEGEALTWDDLAGIDRPVSLEAITPERFSAEILLLGMAAPSAWVLTAQGVAQVELAELAPYWTGRYRFLWQVPKGFAHPLTLGQQSETVAAVAHWFAQLDGQAEPLAQEQFNRVLQERVRLFQREHGLSDDGVIGLQTLLKLNEQLGMDVTAEKARQWFQGALAEGPEA